MRRLAVLLLSGCFAATGCVSSEQYRSLAASYEAYYNQTSAVYLQAVDANVEMPQSVKDAKHHDVEAAKFAIDKAKEVGK